MPCFLFLDDEPRHTLPFRNGRVCLAFANLQHAPEGRALGPDGFELGVWAWVAHREGNHLDRIVLCQRGTTMALYDDLLRRGFVVPAGSPQHKIMIAAVALRVAEELPEDFEARTALLRSRSPYQGFRFTKHGSRPPLR